METGTHASLFAHWNKFKLVNWIGAKGVFWRRTNMLKFQSSTVIQSLANSISAPRGLRVLSVIAKYNLQLLHWQRTWAWVNFNFVWTVWEMAAGAEHCAFHSFPSCKFSLLLISFGWSRYPVSFVQSFFKIKQTIIRGQCLPWATTRAWLFDSLTNNNQLLEKKKQLLLAAPNSLSAINMQVNRHCQSERTQN